MDSLTALYEQGYIMAKMCVMCADIKAFLSLDISLLTLSQFYLYLLVFIVMYQEHFDTVSLFEDELRFICEKQRIQIYSYQLHNKTPELNSDGKRKYILYFGKLFTSRI